VNDYYTTWAGRTPVVITRDKTGELNAFVNACAHRGATICRRKHGNKGSFTCPFHGWTFSNNGKLLKVKDGKTGDYPEAFNTQGSHDLTRLGRFEAIAASSSARCPPMVVSLEDHLGATRTIIDQMVDAAPEGLEVLRGNSSYIYNGNWKLQMENGADGYHVSSVHWNYSATMGHRSYDEAGTRAVDPMAGRRAWAVSMPLSTGIFCSGRNCSIPRCARSRPSRGWLARRAGARRFHRQADAQSGALSQCLSDGPVLDADPRRASDQRERDRSDDLLLRPRGVRRRSHLRIRQYEDFFNVSGMGTPDDLEEFRACQSAYKALAPCGTICRVARALDRPDANARAMGLQPILSGERSEDEGLFVRQHEFGPKRKAQAESKEGGGMSDTDPSARHRADRGFLYREARLLDDAQWDEWLTCYAPGATYWMPAWDDDDQLTQDPQSEISLIYYPNRRGWRIASSASRPSAPAPARPSRAPATSSATSRWSG
jgi:benzoate/toluate 1,2-dioxygenase alpha subunit